MICVVHRGLRNHGCGLIGPIIGLRNHFVGLAYWVAVPQCQNWRLLPRKDISPSRSIHTGATYWSLATRGSISTFRMEGLRAHFVIALLSAGIEESAGFKQGYVPTSTVIHLLYSPVLSY